MSKVIFKNPRIFLLDTETTGLKNPHAWQIAVQELTLTDNNTVATKNRFMPKGDLHDLYFNPQKEMEQGAIAVHGKTDADVADYPSIYDFDFKKQFNIADDETVFLVGQYVQFDIDCLKNTANEQNKALLEKAHPICTKHLSRRLDKMIDMGLERHSLTNLFAYVCENHSDYVTDATLGEHAHNAKYDIQMTLAVLNFIADWKQLDWLVDYISDNGVLGYLTTYSRWVEPKQFEFLKETLFLDDTMTLQTAWEGSFHLVLDYEYNRLKALNLPNFFETSNPCWTSNSEIQSFKAFIDNVFVCYKQEIPSLFASFIAKKLDNEIFDYNFPLCYGTLQESPKNANNFVNAVLINLDLPQEKQAIFVDLETKTLKPCSDEIIKTMVLEWQQDSPLYKKFFDEVVLACIAYDEHKGHLWGYNLDAMFEYAFARTDNLENELQALKTEIKTRYKDLAFDYLNGDICQY